jgi:hypothetical protein
MDVVGSVFVSRSGVIPTFERNDSEGMRQRQTGDAFQRDSKWVPPDQGWERRGSHNLLSKLLLCYI